MWQVTLPFILAVVVTIAINNALPEQRLDGDTHLFVVFFGVWVVGTVWACCSRPVVEVDLGIIDCEEVC